MWRLDTAAYGLVNYNAKWHKMSDNFFRELGLKQCTFMPQLFYARDTTNNLAIVAAKIVGDIIINGIRTFVEQFLQTFNNRFMLGSIPSGPGILRFYGMDMIQNEDYRSTINADDKLGVIETFLLTRCRRRLPDETRTSVERSSFMSVNSSIGWLWISASPLCAFYSSYLQQRSPENTTALS